MMNQVKYSRGFSLVELMIALLLGLLLSVGVINLFIEQKSNFMQTEELARMQENGRFALHLLAKEASLSGFFGGQIDLLELEGKATGVVTEACAKEISTPLTFVDQANHATGLGAGNVIPCVAKVANDVSDLSDVLGIRRVSGSPTVFDGDTLGTITSNEEYLRIVDYGANVAFLQGSSAPSGGGIAPGVDWSLWEYESKTFYVNNDDQLCMEAMTDSFSTSIETCLIDGIEALQVEFGVLSAGGSTIQYKSSPTAAELAEAVSLRIYILTKTDPDGSYTDSKTYNIANLTAYTPNDSFRRRIYTTTAVLRNPVRL